jgi:hypothetical protein
MRKRSVSSRDKNPADLRLFYPPKSSTPSTDGSRIVPAMSIIPITHTNDRDESTIPNQRNDESTQIPPIDNSTPTSPTDESDPIPSTEESPNPQNNMGRNATTDGNINQPKRLRLEFDPNDIIVHPALRIPIDNYASELRSEVRRAYLLNGPTQVTGYVFPQTLDGTISRSFQKSWFDKYDWLEYSMEKDAAFCFYCFLFKKPTQSNTFGNDVFSKNGYTRWKTATSAFKKHVGGPGSFHNIARGECDDFKNQRSSVSCKMLTYSKAADIAYKICLTASLDCARYLVAQGEAFRGHDESSTSINKGNFRELLDWYKDKNDEVKEAFEKGQGNALMISAGIQKDLAKCCAQEVTDVIKN